MLDHTREQYDWATKSGETAYEIANIASASLFVAAVILGALLAGGRI